MLLVTYQKPLMDSRWLLAYLMNKSSYSAISYHVLFLKLTKNIFISIRGADRGRTDDLRLAGAALSQLSYSPVKTFTPTFAQQIKLNITKITSYFTALPVYN